MSGYESGLTTGLFTITQGFLSELWTTLDASFFDYDATKKIEHGGLLHVLPLAVHLNLFCGRHVEGIILRCPYSLSYLVGRLLYA